MNSTEPSDNARKMPIFSHGDFQAITTRSDEASPLDCLILAQSFGEFWAYYSQSDGILYEEPCRKTGTALAASVAVLFTREPDSLAYVQRELDARTDIGDSNRVVQTLSEWAAGSERWPYGSSHETRFTLGPFLMALKMYCLRHVGCVAVPYLTLFGNELDYSSEVLRWKGHLPGKLLRSGAIETLIEQANQTQSIVVVGDICRSQDLMTYALNRDSFSRYLAEFLEGTRTVVEANGGIFDKFTGDGFVAYFNEAVSGAQDLDYQASFLKFVDEEAQFARRLFARWVQTVRKLPPGGIGLAIGADVGVISIQHREGHLIAVGDALVWATRMAAEANSDETVVNNALYHALKNRPNARIAFTERAAQTKTGEGFLAQILHVNHETNF